MLLASGETATAQSSAGTEIASQLGRTSGAVRYGILRDLKVSGRIAKDLTPSDLNLIVTGMEDYRAQAVGLLRSHLAPNLTAADVVSLSGRTAGRVRYEILRDLKIAGRLSKDLSVADLNAIVAGMEDYRPEVVGLLRSYLAPNLSATEVVAVCGGTTGSRRFEIVRDLKIAGRISRDLSVADLNAIVAGMEDRRADVVKLLRSHLAPGLGAEDVAAAAGSGVTTAAGPAPGTGVPGASPGQLPAPAPAPTPAPPPTPEPGVLGACGSSKDFPVFGEYERFFVGDYLCFSSGGLVSVVPGAACAVGVFVGYRPVYFGEACLGHDRCYARAGSRKSQCDEDFLSLMELTCDTSLPDAPRVSWQRSRQTCRGAAVVAYEAVRSRGCNAFRTAQQAAGVTQPSCE